MGIEVYISTTHLDECESDRKESDHYCGDFVGPYWNARVISNGSSKTKVLCNNGLEELLHQELDELHLSVRNIYFEN